MIRSLSNEFYPQRAHSSPTKTGGKRTLTLSGHQDSVNVLRFHKEREWLLSGDDAGKIKLWDLSKCRPIQTIDESRFGPVTAMIWIRLPLSDSAAKSAAFAVGFGLGILALYQAIDEANPRFEYIKAVEAHERPVEALSYDPLHFRLASAGAGFPQVWNLAPGSLLERLTPRPRDINPYFCSSVHFCDSGESLLVTYLETHAVIKYKIDPWTCELQSIARTRIGSAFLDGDSLFVGNLCDGVDQYSIRNKMQRIRHYHYVPKVNMPLQVCLARQSLDYVALGGDDGRIRLFDRDTGKLALELEHSTPGLVQTIDAINSPEQEIIAAAASEPKKQSDIIVWYLKHPQPQHNSSWLESAISPTVARSLRLAVIILIIGTTVIGFFGLFYYAVCLHLLLPAMKLHMQEFHQKPDLSPSNPAPSPGVIRPTSAQTSITSPPATDTPGVIHPASAPPIAVSPPALASADVIAVSAVSPPAPATKVIPGVIRPTSAQPIITLSASATAGSIRSTTTQEIVIPTFTSSQTVYVPSSTCTVPGVNGVPLQPS